MKPQKELKRRKKKQFGGRGGGFKRNGENNQ